MSTRTEITCDRCGVAWWADKGVSARMTGISRLTNLCEECDTEYLALRERQQAEVDAFLEGEEGA